VPHPQRAEDRRESEQATAHAWIAEIGRPLDAAQDGLGRQWIRVAGEREIRAIDDGSDRLRPECERRAHAGQQHAYCDGSRAETNEHATHGRTRPATAPPKTPS